MFMSTRYSKRTESFKDRKIFSANDSLAKLCEYLTTEFSCSKLITPKYKDFRNQKLKFDQKTRLNNAIWRAWHIQYKQKKKARFLQFAAPFSDESSHSLTQAVILEGKYWKKRWDAVSKEYKKWRIIYKEKLLRDGGLDKEELEGYTIGDITDEDDDEESFRKQLKKKTKSENRPLAIPKRIDTVSAMYAIPDTLFSSVDNKKMMNYIPEISVFKDSYAMMQPTLNHLNPCFDELVENFDILNWENYQSQEIYGNRGMSDIMIGSSFQSPSKPSSSIFSVDQFLAVEPDNLPPAGTRNSGLLTPDRKNSDMQEFIFPPQAMGKVSSPSDNLKDSSKLENNEISEKYQELPPQLQAPNLAARLQAIKPKSISQSKSNQSLSTYLSHNSSPSSSCVSIPGVNTPIKQSKRKLKRNLSSSNESSSQSTKYRVHEGQYSDYSLQSKASANILQKRLPGTVPILPKQTNAASTTINITPSQPLIHDHFPIQQPSATFSSLNPSVITNSQGLYHSNTNPHHLTNALGASNVLPSSVVAASQTSASNSLFSNIVAPQVNEQQLLTLAHLLQSTPAQSTEATLSYLELLQQQLNLMLKQQQEQIQLKYHIQAQAQRMIREQHNLQHHQSIGSAASNIISQNSQKSIHYESESVEHGKQANAVASSISLGSFSHSRQSPIQSTEMVSSSNKLPHAQRFGSFPSDVHPPATMDSAMALVSLRHGTINSVSEPPTSTEVFQVEPPTSSTSTESETNESDTTTDVRRQSHLTAEQKRRGLIKNAFDELASMIPSQIPGRTKLSNAAILQKTCDHILHLQHERSSSHVRLNQVQQQIDEVKAAINDCQSKLPATGMSTPRKGSSSVENRFYSYCKELIFSNPKSWIFCSMMKPVFESFNRSVTTKTVDEFLNSVIRWLDQHCSLPLLRPVVLDTLTRLSTSTPFLDDPNCLPLIAKNSLALDDPTQVSNNNENSSSKEKSKSSSSSWSTETWK